MLLGIQREAQYIAVATTDPATGARIQPNVLKNPARNAEFLATQLQSAGYFQLADDEALTQFAAAHPSADLQALRALIRNSRKEQKEGKPPRAYRELFRLLKAIESSTPLSS